MANPDTLVPQAHKLTVEEQSKGGKKSVEVRRQRKTLAQIGDMIGGLDIKSEKDREIMRKAGITDEDMINDVGMLFRLNLKAQKGDTKAIALLSKLRGQLKEQVSAELEYKPIVDLTKIRNKNGDSTEG